MGAEVYLEMSSQTETMCKGEEVKPKWFNIVLLILPSGISKHLHTYS